MIAVQLIHGEGEGMIDEKMPKDAFRSITSMLRLGLCLRREPLTLFQVAQLVCRILEAVLNNG